jgi:heptosyltransferase-2
MKGEKPKSGENADILVVRFGSLGDVMLTLPALSVLRDQNPEARIVYLTKAVYAPLVTTFPMVDEVISLAPEDSSVAGLWRLGRRIRRRRFAAVYDLHGNLRGRAVTWAARAPRRRRVAGRALSRRWRVARATARRLFDRPARPEEPAPALAALMAARVVEPLLTALDLPAPVLCIPAAATAAAARELASLPQPRVALCPGARHATKRWPGFPALAAELARRGAGVLVILGPEDAWDGPANLPVMHPSLVDLAALLAGCDLAIGNDSGLTHVAAAAGTPAVVLFGPTVPALGFRPAGPHRVVEREELGCRPCAVHGGPRCPRGDHACLAEIAPPLVLAAADDLLAGMRFKQVDSR